VGVIKINVKQMGRARVFENRVLRRIFGAKRNKVTGEWRKLHSEELHNLYSSLDVIRQIKSRRMRWAGHVARMGEERKLYKVLMGKGEGKRPPGRPRRRWEDGIRMGLGGCGLDSTVSGQGPVNVILQEKTVHCDSFIVTLINKWFDIRVNTTSYLPEDDWMIEISCCDA
jgi:hypothetical protein